MICKNPKCKKEVPEKAYHFSNQTAVKNGHCSWQCMLQHLEEKAWEKIK